MPSAIYDVVAYPSQPIPQAHPDRLATLATLLGMAPAGVEACRVLELGCGDGGNLIALAFALPGSAFVGVDLAASAITSAKEEAQALGLTNVEFHCADVLDWTPPEAPFDYVTAHGLFSWVPEAVRLRVLELCRDRLAPQGVAYVSYNTMPGFDALARRHGLQFLAEADFFEMQDWIYPAPVVEALRPFAGNIVLKEQYLDFLRGRRFRQALLCRADVHLDREPGPELMRHFLIASQARPKSANPSLAAGAAEGFTGPRGAGMQLDQPLAKAALLQLRTVWPRALPFADLLKAARGRLGQPPADRFDDEARGLAETVLAGHAAGLVELHLFQAAWAAVPGERPVLSPLARVQLDRGREIVTSLRHTGTKLDVPILRQLLLLLDGSRDVQAVAAELGRRIDAGELPLPAGASRQDLPTDVEKALRDAAAAALLIA